MVHDLVLALVFLAMIIAPALLAMRTKKEERRHLSNFESRCVAVALPSLPRKPRLEAPLPSLQRNELC